MSPTALGEYCIKCGAKCTVNLEPAPDGDSELYVFRCPNGHGPQLILDGPTLPEGEPTETATLQWPLKETDVDVPLTTTPETVVVGSIFLIDAEYMTVSDVSNSDNPVVTRATRGSLLDYHPGGAEVTIWSES